MNVLFILLFVLSFVLLGIGLVKPSTVKMASRKQVALVFGIMFVVTFVLVGVTAPKTPTEATVTTSHSVPAAQASTSSGAASVPTSATKQTTNSSAVTQPAPAAQPTVLLQLKGSGTKSSQTFTAPDSWTLSYTYDCSNFGDSGNFQVYIQNNDGSLSTLSPVNELGKSGSDTEYYHQGGQLYLEVNSECDWTVTAKG